MTNVFDELIDKAIAAPYGYRKKDGKPRKRPPSVPPHLRPVKQRKPPPEPPQQPPAPDPAQSADQELKRLHRSLSRLGKKSIAKLMELLEDGDKRIRLQAAGVATRASLMGLARDALGAAGGAEIHIHTTVQVAQAGQPAPGSEPPGKEPPPGQHQRQGKPVMITK